MWHHFGRLEGYTGRREKKRKEQTDDRKQMQTVRVSIFTYTCTHKNSEEPMRRNRKKRCRPSKTECLPDGTIRPIGQTDKQAASLIQFLPPALM
mmetsp:Transcript_15044/g.30456  ORF Transcript_15044/g.30456 Transcript_15044/m.30456 type:complete len:94 (+) Transcript_15044:2003-2284(+)